MIHITVPSIPPSPNVLRRKYRNPHTYRRLRKQWENDLFYGVSCSRHRNDLIALATATQQMQVQVTIYHTKPFDDDNLVGALKPILDALRNIGFIANDSPDKLELLPTTQVIGPEECKTVVKIGPKI
jgi:hypothetical protein